MLESLRAPDAKNAAEFMLNGIHNAFREKQRARGLRPILPQGWSGSLPLIPCVLVPGGVSPVFGREINNNRRQKMIEELRKRFAEGG